MENSEDDALERRVRDIVAVATKDLDTVRVEVEDGVAYVEGVVGSQEEADAILRVIERLDGLKRVVTWLSIETVVSVRADKYFEEVFPPPAFTHYYSQS